MRLLRAATLTVPDVKASVARYREWFDYTVVEEGELERDLALSWGAPANAGRRYAVLEPASMSDVYLRFVEGEFRPDYLPLRTYGWAAIEICVKDVLAVNERMKRSPFEIIGPPREIAGLPAIFPMQVEGPDREIVYLTQIRDNLPAYDLPRAETLIDKLFICVLACSDMRKSAKWFEEVVGLSFGREMTIEYTMLQNAFGTPPERLYTISTLVHERDVFLELDQYPEMATPRAHAPDALPPGVSMLTLKSPNFSRIPGDWITPPRHRDGPVYGGARVGALRAPDGALVEIVEVAR
jgi:catechol 2,3-dioxygenase-like lactoylglutathione lyase family enzyme